MSDDEMEIRAHFFLGHGRTYQNQLRLKDPDLTPNWFDGFEHAIELAENAEPVEGRRATNKVKTAQQQLSLREARGVMQDLFFYVDKAFSTSPATQQLFGTTLYDGAAYNVGKMRDLLALAHKSVTDPAYLPALQRAHYPDASIQRLGELAGVLTADQTAAGLIRTRHKVSTEDFIKLHNAVWEQMVMISDAAKRAFLGDESIRRLFALYPPVDGSSTLNPPAAA